MKNTLYFLIVIIFSCKPKSTDNKFEQNGNNNLKEVIKSEKEKFYNVKLISENETEYDTLVKIDYIEDDLFGFIEFNYPKLLSKKKNKNSITLFNENLSIRIVIKDFDTINNSIEYSKTGNYVATINGKEFWGTDGGIPRKEISKIEISKENKISLVSSQEFDNLYSPNINCREIDDFCYTNGYITENNEIIITMANSDGAGAYTVIFIFNKNLSIEKKIVGFAF